MTILRSRRIVTPAGELDGWLRIDGDRITGISQGEAAGAVVDVGTGIIVPGFIDIHNHGGAGGWVTSGDAQIIRASLDLHRAHGSTGIMISLMSAPIEELEHTLDEIVKVASDPLYRDRVLGIHLEGPFLSPERSGAQPKEFLVLPSAALVSRLLDRGAGLIRMVTIAPELEGAAEAILLLRFRGVTVAVGHSAASYETATAAFDTGAGVATHVFNGMPPLQSRAPGVVGGSLMHPRVVCELIIDGVHVHEANVRLALAAAGAERIAFVTDAAAVAGLHPGTYPVQPRPLEVRDGAAYDLGTGDLVGSIMTLSDALARAVQVYG